MMLPVAAFVSDRRWVFAIYAIPFVEPLYFQGTARAAAAMGCVPALSLGLAYVALLIGIAAVWLLVHRLAEVDTIAPLQKPFGLPAFSVDAFAALLAAVAIFSLPFLVGPFGQDSRSFESSASGVYRTLSRVGLIIVFPIVEEIGGRWLLYRGLRPARANAASGARRLICVAPAVVISGVFFGLGHYLVSSAERLVPTMIMGMLLALAYEVTGRLWVPIVAHVLVNMHGNLVAEFGPVGRFGLIASVAVIAVLAWVALIRGSADLRAPWGGTDGDPH